jgi:HD superfamily phosphohydrolase YqeK
MFFQSSNEGDDEGDGHVNYNYMYKHSNIVYISDSIQQDRHFMFPNFRDILNKAL